MLYHLVSYYIISHYPLISHSSEMLLFIKISGISWWRHQMETFSALLAICAENSPVTGEFSAQRPVTRSCDVFFNLRLNKWLSKQWWGWWFETPSCPLWRHRNVNSVFSITLSLLFIICKWYSYIYTYIYKTLIGFLGCGRKWLLYD